MKLLKNIKYKIVLLAFAVLFSACNDYIEEDIFSDITSENFIDENTADQLVVGVYTQLRSVYKNYGYKFLGTDIFTIKGELFSTSSENDYFAVTAPDGNGVWSSNYNVIAKANTAINRYENQINWSDTNLDDKAYGIAQARALRALAYFNLVVQYGGVALELEEPQSIRTDYTRSSEEETYTLIIAELEAAIPDLLDTPETGRFSKRAAQHLLSEVYLTRAYKSYAGTNDFETAATLAESAIGGYDIRSQSYAEVFDFDNQVNDEVLFAVQFGNSGFSSDKSNTKHSLFMYSVFNYESQGVSRANPYGGVGSSGMPTPYFYSLFADDDERENATIHRTIIADKEGVMGTDNIVAGDTVVYYPKKALDIAELTDKLDRYWVYQPDQYLYMVPDDIPGVNYLYSASPSQNIHFPIFKKFDDEDINAEIEGSRDTFVFRVAESHLLAAEAYLGANDPVNALIHLNRVRERATGVANYYTSISVDDILVERALELAGESNRWAVLKRTGKLEERIELYNPHVIDHGAFDPDIHYLRPIPNNELVISPTTMEQNPGY
ncbi:MAG: RagB/SusD family nutrient uptake outer membrane protein [Algibacter sp.]|uniref:RagB/SusD family nutrient uptake outer membrane protein n=1 Tax=Algibacter sp. TaxID=1872428 RepID=UPI003297D494